MVLEEKKKKYNSYAMSASAYNCYFMQEKYLRLQNQNT